MFYEIYIDSIFLMNLVLNLYLLTLTAKSLRRTATRLRIVVGAAAGALGGCVVLCLPLGYSGKILIGLIPVSIGMCKLTFRSKGLINVLRETGFLFVYAFLLGGFMLFWLRRVAFLGRHSGKIWCVLGMGYLSYGALDFFLKRHRRQKENPFCQVTIPCGAEEVRVTALLDTGNGLTEPVSGKPVSVLEEPVWAKLKPLMRAEKRKVIPYHSVGNSHGLMEGYELASMTVEREGQKVCYEKVIVGICKERISAGGQYQMILPPEF